MKTNETYGTQIAEALANCAPLAESSEERDELWLVVHADIQRTSRVRAVIEAIEARLSEVADDLSSSA